MAMSTDAVSVAAAVRAGAPAGADSVAADPARLRDFIFKFTILVLACLWIYSPVYDGDWLWDDDTSVTNNATMKGPWNFHDIWIVPTSIDYFPLTATGFWLEWHAFGPIPTGYHMVNIGLHILAALALWRLLDVMKLPGPWLGAVVFAVHPVCVESVAWVSELKNTLSQPLFLAAAISFVKFDDALHGTSEPAPGSSPEWEVGWNYALATLFFLLAMFAKTSVVMFPIVILLYAWWKRGGIGFWDLVASVPFFVISLVLGLATIYFQHGRAIGPETIPVGGVESRIATAGMAILFYLWTSVWPFDLSPIYVKWQVDPPRVWQFLPWPLMAAAVWWLWRHRGTATAPTWQRHALFVLGFFVLMLFPILGFITIAYMRITWVADHFLYLPFVAVIPLVVAGLVHVYGRLKPREQSLAVVVAALVLMALGTWSFNYAHAWAGEESLWPWVIASHPNPCHVGCGCWQAHNRLGAKKYSRGDIDAAHYHFQSSSRLRPDLGETLNNLGTTHSARSQIYGQRGDKEASKREIELAIAKFDEARRVSPHLTACSVNLAGALMATGRLDEAVDVYADIVRQHPNDATAVNNFGVVLFKAGRKDRAIEQFRRALELKPDLQDARRSLQVALGELPESAVQPPPGVPPVPPAAGTTPAGQPGVQAPTQTATQPALQPPAPPGPPENRPVDPATGRPQDTPPQP